MAAREAGVETEGGQLKFVFSSEWQGWLGGGRGGGRWCQGSGDGELGW